MKKRHLVMTAAGLSVVLLIIVLIVASKQQLERRRLFRDAEPAGGAPAEIPPVERWTGTFASLSPEGLVDLLPRIEREQKNRYDAFRLGYLHARALIAAGEMDEAATRLQPFLAEGHPFRPLALYHQAEIEQSRGNRDAASRIRHDLIFNAQDSQYQLDAIEEELAFLEGEHLIAFAEKVRPTVETGLRRDIDARIAEALLGAGQRDRAVSMALALLNDSIADDPADRVARAIDQREILSSLTAEQVARLAETLQSHRHFDRAAALYQTAIPRLPKRANELRFALGRSFFGNEKYAEAQRTYASAAAATNDGQWKATFLFHASRAAQLQGNDQAGEQLMTSAIAVKGNFSPTNAALTQRIRTRVRQRRFAQASSDLALLRRIAPNDRAPLEGALALALGQLGAGNAAAALATLNSVPRARLNEYDRAEFDYWRARALESRDLPAAFEAYLSVLRSTAPNHFAYFARDRLDSPALAGKLQQELQRREAEVARLIAAADFATAKRVQTDRVLLSSTDHAEELKRLAGIYEELPPYREILNLTPDPLPTFPVDEDADRTTLLMAMSLHDEAIGPIQERWPLQEPKAALTQSIALNLGGASRESIRAVEVLMRSVPDDYVPDLLPVAVRQLLYPRYFYTAIVRDAERFGADPLLVLSIMREESRFNPRAKSAAAARGLLQFIITTARDIGRHIGLVDVAPEDLYDPRIIISLGAKYVANLMEEFEGNRYRATAAYNAGPYQVKLWSRLAPAAGDDFFLSAINFDETKHYVRKVMNSYKRYGEIYEEAPPAGGITIEP
ncbi:MAG TPA: lytic transglycosylase domain-containing protein [Thermoanaerobaculia bacterium]|nr:lytic transglycosylase domain-containing protein [Thermoanaerobaculia bacterium]